MTLTCVVTAKGKHFIQNFGWLTSRIIRPTDPLTRPQKSKWCCIIF